MLPYEWIELKLDMVTLCWKHYKQIKDKSAIIGYKMVNGKLTRYVKEYVV